MRFELCKEQLEDLKLKLKVMALVFLKPLWFLDRLVRLHAASSILLFSNSFFLVTLRLNSFRQ
jgi:hypothetical protein